MEEKRIKKTFEIETSPAVMGRFERFLALLHYNSAFGHSSTFAMALDGDGADKVVISPQPLFKNEVDMTGGVDEAIKRIINKEGKDNLARICEHYGWDSSAWDDGIRSNSEY